MKKIKNSNESKWKIDEEYLNKALVSISPPSTKPEIHLSLSLPFKGQEDLNEALYWLFEKMDYECFRYMTPEYEDDPRILEFFPYDITIFIRDKLIHTELSQDRNLVVITFKMGKRYLDEKPS